MSNEIRTEDEIYDSLRDNLTDRISKLTNFTEGSFNYVWTQAFSSELREREVQLVASKLSGWVDYAGGPLTEDDLDDLGIEDDVDTEELEEFFEDDDLDNLVAIVGVERDEGSPASGTVTFTTQNASTTIPEGTEVGTQPDSSGEFVSYETTEGAETESGETTVDVSIEAADVGSEGNVGAGSITYLPSPPSGVQAVTNADAVDGGEDRESNDDLRERAKEAVFRSSGGGTVEGMVGYIEENTGATEVTIIENYSGNDIRDYPHGEVIVVGGTDDEVEEAIEESRPTSVEHILRRPATITLDIDMVADGEDINTSLVDDDITEYLNSLELDDDLFEDKIIFTAMGADEAINNISSLEYSVSEEAFFFDSSKDVYTMQLDEEMKDDAITEVTGTLLDDEHTFEEDTDYQEWNSDSDDDSTPHDSIDWSVGRSSETHTFAYEDGKDEYEVDEDMVHNGVTSVENTTTGTTLDEGDDYEIADTNDDNLHDGIRFLEDQSDEDDIEVEYEAGDLPDVRVDQSQEVTFNEETRTYRIDDALIEDGITEVTGTLSGSEHTFEEGTDYDEWDSNGDGSPEGIEWLTDGDTPDDDTTFSITYDAGTQFLVDYDVEVGDITIDADEKINAGSVTVEEL